MAKFNVLRRPVTHEGGVALKRGVKHELFLLAVANMVGERSFYETAEQRDDRFTQLVRTATVEDPEWTARLLGWLRGTANMRSASIVGAAEFAHARTEPGLTRQVVNSVLQRADEPGEFLSYWLARHGRAIPKPVRRGIGDAVRRLYDERSLLKWDSEARGVRMGDVLNLTHPKPAENWQGALFTHALDRRYGNVAEIPTNLPVVKAREELLAWPVERRRELFAGDAVAVLKGAGMTWEAVAGWLQGPLTAEVWTALIPTMGYMALLRNLRNFDQAGVPDDVAATVAAKLADPEQVARSRQLPMRFLSAYRAAPSLRWAWALERALDASLANVPSLPGRTLVLVDRSGSMFYSKVSRNSDLTRADAAAVFGTAIARRAAKAELVQFGSTAARVALRSGESVLPVVQKRFSDLGGTDTVGALRKFYRGHDRVVIVTDEQHNGRTLPTAVVPAGVPVYTWNLAGYEFGHTEGRFTFGGLSDAAFGMVPLMEAGGRDIWPF
ncbi:TROVE domain-containing protein [Kutzneria buriramensis]|uniref:TROVE domain-containing protein n=1 Tax=Kutzneria buriramensis TaxID=1045776 RepID=A0A3E0HCH1_9PSEU|nr:TROVE domain-containing protein [Kutzneria buriramensis]REH42547.1 TROVE domain-containing protein [Kutzneria buriramensis]